MFRIEVGGVVPAVQSFHHVVVQVGRFDVTVTDETICVGETQPNLVSVSRLQAIVEKLIHYQITELQYAKSHGDGLV